MSSETSEKPKKPRAARPPAPPKSADELVTHALLTAAKKPTAKWTGTTAAALFNTKEANHEAAIAECLRPGAELLRQVGKGGALTAAGFARVADLLPAERLTEIATACAAPMPAAERVEFLTAVIGRSRDSAAELVPVLEAAVAEKRAALEAATREAARRAANREASRAALERALALLEEDHANEVRAWQFLGEKLGQRRIDLPAPARAAVPDPAPEPARRPQQPAPEPRTQEERDFRRYECDRLAAAWREAWDANKHEGRDYLETAMWNMRGFRIVGEVGQEVPFDGRRHESTGSVFTDDPVRVVRPGWLLKTDDEEYIALKALVEDARGG